MAKAKATKLTLKQEAFCQAYIETGNASEAYRRAYNARSTTGNSLHVRASELLKNSKVAVRLRQLTSQHAERHNITVDSLTEMLKNAYDLAMRDDVQSPAAAVSAALGIGKLHGLVVDKKHVKGEHDHKHAHEHRTVSESAEWLAGVLGSREDRTSSKPVLN